MPTDSLVGASGHRGHVFLGDITLRVHRYSVTWSAPEEPLPIVTSGGTPTAVFSGVLGSLVPPVPDSILLDDTWASGYVLGPPRFEALLECYYLESDNPFGQRHTGRYIVRIGSIARLILHPDWDGNLDYQVVTDLLISKIEMTQAVRSPVTYTIGGVGLRRATYATPLAL